MPGPVPEDIIAATIKRVAPDAPTQLPTIIVLDLWEAGYEVSIKPDLIPIRHNPGEGGAAQAVPIRARVPR